MKVFLKTSLSFGLVNLKPLLPGHTLICPLKPHRRLTDLSPAELTDLYTAVQVTQRMLAREYFPRPEPEAGSFNVAIQDGAEAGQTVPHLHVHIIPRVKDDLPSMDDVYGQLSGEEGNVGGALWDSMQRPAPGGGVPRVDDEDRKPRSVEDMAVEVERYKSALAELNAGN